jgi:hypothetical protein
MGGKCIMYGKVRNAYKILDKNPQGKRQFQVLGHNWKDQDNETQGVSAGT